MGFQESREAWDLPLVGDKHVTTRTSSPGHIRAKRFRKYGFLAFFGVITLGVTFLPRDWIAAPDAGLSEVQQRPSPASAELYNNDQGWRRLGSISNNQSPHTAQAPPMAEEPPSSAAPRSDDDQASGNSSEGTGPGNAASNDLYVRSWTIVSLFGMIIVLSISFEEFQNYIYSHLKKHGNPSQIRMIDALFKELTILGY